MLETKNSYYHDIFQVEGTAKIIDMVDHKIYLDHTLFYAESGGQECDLGQLGIKGRTLEVVDVQYEKSETLWRTAHIISPEIDLQSFIEIGDEANLSINLSRRKKLSAYHTASHLLFIAAEQVRPGIQQQLIGCHIKEDSARFDFLAESKFDEKELFEIGKFVNQMVEQNLHIETYYVDEHSGERVWECNGIKIPCGGTHLSNTGQLNLLNIKRKGIGKGKERLICFTDHILQGEICA